MARVDIEGLAWCQERTRTRVPSSSVCDSTSFQALQDTESDNMIAARSREARCLSGGQSVKP